MDTKSRQLLGKIASNFEELGQEPPLFKNSKTHFSKDWRTWDKCTVYPIQRKLSKNECFFDIDKMDARLQEPLFAWLDSVKFKHSAFQTSQTGDTVSLHIHFFTPVEGKYKKLALVTLLGKKIKELFGIDIDLHPMTIGATRTEWSMKDGEYSKMKIMIRDKIPRLFPQNDISPVMIQKVFEMASRMAEMREPNKSSDGNKCRTCVKKILEGTFNDCRKRLMFCVASHYVSQKDLSKEDAISLTWDWAKRHGSIEYKDVVASVNSSQGRVGCTLRHTLLEEVGQPVYNCKWE